MWHGRAKTGIVRLNQVIDKLEDKTAIIKVKELIKYISNNEQNIINYHVRKIKKLPYSSQLAESSVNELINNRQKKRKMQWTRTGAHNILQIRTSVFSKTWNQDWAGIEGKLYKAAA